MAKTLIGIVSSDKAEKTIVVTVQTRKTHPLYKKQYTVSKKFMAHNENNEAKMGDKVSITETRPISARKHYTLTKILERPLISQDQTVEAITKEEAVEEKKTAQEITPEDMPALPAKLNTINISKSFIIYFDFD